MRRAACEEVGCPAWLHGWVTRVDEGTGLGKQQAAYIRTKAGRTFTEARDGALTVFRFEARQRCFADHRTIGEAFSVVSGDWRRYGGVIRRHANGRDWAEDFALHQDRIADQQQKG